GSAAASGRQMSSPPQPAPQEGEVRRAQERDPPPVPDFRDVPDGAHPSPWSVTRQTPPVWLAAYRPARRVATPASVLPEPAAELAVVVAVHVTVPVEVEVPQVPGLRGGRPERGPEPVAVLPVHVPVAVRVAEQTEEGLRAVAAPIAAPVAVEFPAALVADTVAPNGERVAAVRQRAADDVRPGEGQDGDGAAIDHRGGNVQPDRAAILAL